MTWQHVKCYLKFLVVGLWIAGVEEFLTIVVLKRQFGAFVATMLVVFPVFLTLVWLISAGFKLLIHREGAYELTHFCFFGGVGLALEWFVMGLSPWSNPEAHPLLMFAFQLGMFSFWATVAFVPLLFVQPDFLAQRTRQSLLKFYVPYFVMTYVTALTVPPEARFVTIVGLVVVGHVLLNVYYVLHFRRRFVVTQATQAI